MSHFVESNAHGRGFFAIFEESANLGFGGRAHDVAHDAGLDENGTIVRVRLAFAG